MGTKSEGCVLYVIDIYEGKVEFYYTDKKYLEREFNRLDELLNL